MIEGRDRKMRNGLRRHNRVHSGAKEKENKRYGDGKTDKHTQGGGKRSPA